MMISSDEEQPHDDDRRGQRKGGKGYRRRNDDRESSRDDYGHRGGRRPHDYVKVDKERILVEDEEFIKNKNLFTEKQYVRQHHLEEEDPIVSYKAEN